MKYKINTHKQMDSYTSEFIFQLADKFQISYDNNKPKEFSDENYINFRKEYAEKCQVRDRHLKTHLINNSNTFRTFLPWRPYLFDTVFQTQWYYDELVIYDPIFFQLNNTKEEDLETKKDHLRQILHFLNRLKDSINSGFLLLGSYEIFQTEKNNDSTSEFESLLSQPAILNECDRLVEVYKMESQEGNEKGYFQVRSEYRGISSFINVIEDVENLKSDNGYSLSYNFSESNYIPLSVDEVKLAGLYDRVYESFHKDYPNELKEIFDYLNIGLKINTPVLFDRKIDELVLNQTSRNEFTNRSKAIDFYQFFLPFVDGIPPEKLYELREKMPSAFFDFRRNLFTIINDLEKEELAPDILKLKIEQKINPILKRLDAEIKNSLNTAKIIGGLIPLASGMASLGLSYFDLPQYSHLVAGGVGLINEGRTLTKYMSEKNLARSNDLYYLWRVQKERKK